MPKLSHEAVSLAGLHILISQNYEDCSLDNGSCRLNAGVNSSNMGRNRRWNGHCRHPKKGLAAHRASPVISDSRHTVAPR
jgi:hypothetical protein